MSTLKVTHLQNESNSAPSISISSAVGGGVTFAGISTFHSSVNIGGNLGIGIDNPESTSQLHIKNTSGNAKITLETNETYDSYINFSGATAEASIGYEPTSNSVIISNSADGLTSNERLRITSGGSLQVKGDTNPNAVFDRGSANTTNVNFNYNGTLTGQLGAANAEFQISASGASTPLVAYVNGAERLRITSGGDLGLGVSANMSQAGTLHLIGGQGVRWQHPTGGALYGDHYVSATGKHVFRTGSSLTTQAEIDDTGIKLPSGKGINFSAYATSGNPSSNLLDDYEEGTWNPVFSTETNGASGQVYAGSGGLHGVGRYTKIGRIVHCSFDVALTNRGTFTGTYVLLGGLPFTNMQSNNTGGVMTIGWYDGWNLPTGGSTITAYISTTNCYIMTPTTADGNDYLLTSNVATQMTNGSRLIGQLVLNLVS